MKIWKKGLCVLLSFVLVALSSGSDNVTVQEATVKAATTNSQESSIDYSDYEEIATPADMDKLSYVVDGKYYLSADIDMDQYDGTYTPVSGFKGVLDGRGHSIKNLDTSVINSITGSATVRDLKIEDFNSNSNSYGSAKGILVDSISLSSEDEKAEVRIEDITANGRIRSGTCGGTGLCGEATASGKKQNIIFQECYVDLDFVGYQRNVGGIIGYGYVFRSTSTICVENCYTTGSITDTYGFDMTYGAGGIVGKAAGKDEGSGSIEIKNCYSDMNIYTSAGGGMVGINYYNLSLKISDCISNCYINARWAGGLMGGNTTSVDRVEISNCISLSDKITGRTNAGAVILSGRGTVTLDKVFTYSKLYDEENRTYLTDENATALNAQQLTEESSFSGLDFTNTFSCVPGVNAGRILLKQLTWAFQVDTPTFEVVENSDSTKTVQITSGCEGANIYYTNVAGTVDSSSTLYTGPITLDKTTYFKVIATKDGYRDSELVEETVAFQVAAPTADKAEGSYTKAFDVSLSCDTEGATIYYTLDGKSPTSSSEKYTGTPISFDKSGTTTLKMIAVKDGWTSSNEVTYVYNLSITEGGDSLNQSLTSTTSDNDEENEVEDDDSDTSTVQKPGKVSGVSVKNKAGKKLYVKWKKKNSVSGFQIQYAQNKKFTVKKKTKNVGKGTSSKTFSGLKKGKMYYVRVRAYNKKNSKVVYGNWSNVKKVKIKK